ncbi:MAG: glycosyltransferase family 2 protein [Elusimicrobiota bacterium]
MDAFVSIALVVNVLALFFFLQLIGYGIYSYFLYWSKTVKFTTEKLVEVSKTINRGLPKITVLIAAKDEASVISATIAKMVELEYPKDKLRFIFVLDEKEREENPYENTTHYYVEERQKYYNTLYNTSLVNYVSVPKCFDGNYPGCMLKDSVHSTKPRALNWALRFIDDDTDILGFYDADSHPQKDTLLVVANKFITEQDKELFMQGSVIQVRNYFSISLLNKIYALNQGMTHEWFLPILLKHLPFIGGTNFFIDKKLMLRLNGFDADTLTEDLDFGIKAYLKEKKWPDFLPCVTLEQTPPNYKSYFVQRARWAAGLLQVTQKVMKHKLSTMILFIIAGLMFYGFIPLVLFQIVALSSLLYIIVPLIGGVESLAHHVFPEILFFNAVYIAYVLLSVWYFVCNYQRNYIAKPVGRTVIQKLSELLIFLVLPVAPLLGCMPYTYGMIKGLVNKSSLRWVKTTRTYESITE